MRALSTPCRLGPALAVTALTLVALPIPRVDAQTAGQAPPAASGQAPAEHPLPEITPSMSREERLRLLRAHVWEVQAVRVRGSLRIDGRLDDEAWQAAPAVSEFYQRERYEGLPATERTEVRVLYDDDYLYVGFRCFDSRPERVRARAIFRDESGGADDLVAIMVDAYHDHRSAIQFVSNANGLMEDLLQTGENESTRNHNFDTVWLARGSRMPHGFDVEFAIPFKSLRFEPPADGEPLTMGIGFKRNIPRKNEEVYWPFVPNDSTWYRPAELGHLRGLRDVRPGRNLQVRPYGLAGTIRDFTGGLGAVRRDAGLDVKWGVTTGLTADFTVNTDFAQEEVDTQQINFTRFSLFFPEKRQFFLENEQMFRFGLPQQAELVFTRRIGLSDTGDMVPILAGARLAGREGRTTVGALVMQTDAAGTLPSENFAVVRVRRDVFTRSSLGAVVTNRAGGGRVNRAFGADANFFVKDVWFVQGWVAAVDGTTTPADATAAYGRVAYDRDRLGASYTYLDVGAGFDPGVGFVRRRDLRRHTADWRWSPRPRSALVRQFDVTASLDYLTTRANVLETRERQAAFKTNFETGDAVTASFTDTLEALDRPFRLRSNVTIPVGTYRFRSTSFRLDTFRRRHATLNLTYTTGGFWTGTRDTLSIRANYRMATRFGVSVNYDINWVDLPQGPFVTHLASSRVQVALRNDLAVQGLFQYNRDTQQLATNLRFNWILKPGSELYVVYNELDHWWAGFAPKNRSVVVKMNYLFAL